MKTKNKKTMIERLREIRDKISLDIMDLNFEETQKYFAERRKKFEEKEKLKRKRKKYKTQSTSSVAAEPTTKYGKR